ncbi:MAG: orotidine-5'-phosphate decarboxylase, partial [Muribaculaceae bacterium]|nr:orotidine-5'-phosphate decarboxylase [Muribaculaceae bacterium]
MKRRELVDNILAKKSFLCVGLDPDQNKMPAALAAKGAEGMLEFNKAIIDATAPYAVAFKPNLAFYEVLGPEGLDVFEKTCSYIKEKYPDTFLIADAKRGDIGNTARMYAKAFYDRAGVDAVTVAPYMGEDSVMPFLDFKDKWTVLLALTSNKGGDDFQMMSDVNGARLFERVIKRSLHWGSPVNLMYVIGATRGELIADARKVAPRSFFLVPGVGAQGGSLEEVCKYGMIDEVGLLVNSSRGIIHASAGDDFAEAAAKKAAELAGQMATILDDYFK